MDQVFSVWGMLVVGIVGMTIGAVVDTLAKAWRKARVAEIQASLKAEMIKQGRSADEIERILNAGGKSAAEE